MLYSRERKRKRERERERKIEQKASVQSTSLVRRGSHWIPPNHTKFRIVRSALNALDDEPKTSLGRKRRACLTIRERDEHTRTTC